MIDLPGTTNVYRPMPKELFYKYLHDDHRLKKIFTDEISSIIWMATLSTETMAIPKGIQVTEIAIIEIVLKRQAISPDIIEIIDREIDRVAVFIVRYEEWGQLWCGDYRSYNRNYYQTDWMLEDNLNLKLDGGNLDLIYQNVFIQITGKPFPANLDSNHKQAADSSEVLMPAGKNEQLERLEATIKKLDSQMNQEVQFGKQFKLATEIKQAQAEIKKIKQSMTTALESPEIAAATEASVENRRSFLPNLYLKMQGDQNKRYDYSLL